MTLAELNQLPEAQLSSSLFACCGSANWVQKMLSSRPFESFIALEATSNQTWTSLGAADWLEAFSQHPKIGETARISQWSAQEQSGMNAASPAVSERLAELNRQYFGKFGWIFIVCATGKSAEEMLSILEARLPNSPEQEIHIAAAEQNKIAALRLRKLLAL